MSDDKVFDLSSRSSVAEIEQGLQDRMVKVLEHTIDQVRTGQLEGYVLCVMAKRGQYAVFREGSCRLLTTMGMLHCALDDLSKLRETA